ncbi:hypothetical protein Noda2021_00300 [Candidatus Dependentiae bacterium Noda2021]|nr:hypothetical protein Noda2021_00300 [Candidatus Dependentiae bacterium Noda2021]
MNRRLLLIILLFTIFNNHFSSSNPNNVVNQLPTTRVEKKPNRSGDTITFCTPVCNVGVNRFIKDIFNEPLYAEEFLPNNFSHLLELLQKKNKSGDYIKSVLRLFTNKIKASNYVNSYSIDELLVQLPPMLKKHFVIDQTRQFESTKEIIHELMYSSLSSQFTQFKNAPSAFLTDLSAKIEEAVELRKVLVLFLETAISKLVWCPQDQLESWKLVRNISDHLADLYENQLITDVEDLNSLYITLIERYCVFLDIANPYLNADFYTSIKNDITSETLSMFAVAEQENALETKAQRLLRSVLMGQARLQAREHGLIL